MSFYKITYLNLGECTINKGVLTRDTGVGEMIRIPITALAIEGNGLKVLVDTGFKSVEYAQENACYCSDLSQNEQQKMEGALAKIGWKPDDVDIVINTHLHSNHCGGNALFKNAKFYIQKKEWEQAMNPVDHQAGMYKRELFDATAVDGTSIVLIEGETEIQPGLIILSTPGHTAGHQSVLVNTEDGIVIFAGGACPLLENMQRNILPNILTNSPMAYKSLADFSRKGEFIIPSNDAAIPAFATKGFLAIH